MIKNILVIAIFGLLLSCNSPGKKRTTSYVSPTGQSELQQSMERGGLVYTDFCMQCHLTNGMGVPGTFPPLAGSDWLAEKRTESIHSVKYGQKGEIQVNGVTYDGVMVPMGLTNEEVADVMNYIMNSWGNTQDGMVTPEEVEAVEK